MRLVTRAELAERIRRRVKMTNSNFVSDDELDDLISESVTELYDLLVTARGHEYYRATAYQQTAIGQCVYALPSDFYQMVGVCAYRGTFNTSAHVAGSVGGPSTLPRQDWHRLDPFLSTDVADLLNTGSPHPFATRYRLAGRRAEVGDDLLPAAQIELLPMPSEVWTLRLDYVPTPNTYPTEEENGISFDGIAGWEKYVVCAVAIELLDEEESDTTTLKQELERQRARIEGLAGSRDAGRLERVSDVQALVGPNLWDVPRRPRWP